MDSTLLAFNRWIVDNTLFKHLFLIHWWTGTPLMITYVQWGWCYEISGWGVWRMHTLTCTGWPRKNATLTINDFSKLRDRINKLCPLLRIKLFSNKMTPRSLILMKAFGFYGSFSEAMSFSKFATSVAKVTIDVPKMSIVWLPRVKCLLLLGKTKTAWIKRSIHYVILQCYNPGKAFKEIPHYLNRDFWYCAKEANFENDIASEKGL